MPTRTDPFASPQGADVTGHLPVIPLVGPVALDHPSPPPLAPAPVEPVDGYGLPVPELDDEPAAYATFAQPEPSALAGALHALSCDCLVPGDAEGHGVDFEALAENVRGHVLAAEGLKRAPVEAKVWAGLWGTVAATVGLALVTLLLGSLDVIPELVGGSHPWVGVVVMALGVVLPPVASFCRSYLAEHTIRASDLAPAGSAAPTEGDSAGGAR